MKIIIDESLSVFKSRVRTTLFTYHGMHKFFSKDQYAVTEIIVGKQKDMRCPDSSWQQSLAHEIAHVLILSKTNALSHVKARWSRRENIESLRIEVTACRLSKSFIKSNLYNEKDDISGIKSHDHHNIINWKKFKKIIPLNEGIRLNQGERNE